jgi:hypothetical protein
VCDVGVSIKRRPRPVLGCWATEKKNIKLKCFEKFSSLHGYLKWRIFIIYVDRSLTPYAFRFTLTESRSNVCFSACHILQGVVTFCHQHGPTDSQTSVDTGVHRTQTRVFAEPSINWNRSAPNDSIYIEAVVPVLEMLIC